jgi:hypothetical protein
MPVAVWLGGRGLPVADDNSFRLDIDGDTVATVLRATSREIHQYKANATQQPARRARPEWVNRDRADRCSIQGADRVTTSPDGPAIPVRLAAYIRGA